MAEETLNVITGLTDPPEAMPPAPKINPAVDYWRQMGNIPSTPFNIGKMTSSTPSDVKESDIRDTWFTPTPPQIAPWMTSSDVYEARAEAQNFGQKAINGAIKFAAKVPLYVGGALINIPVSIAEAFAGNPEALMGQGDFAEAILEVDDYLAKELPHYYTSKQQASLTGGAGNFIFDTLLGAAAFTTSAVLTEYLTLGMAKGVGAAGMFSRMAYNMSKAKNVLTGSAIMSARRAAAASKAFQIGKAVDSGSTAVRQLITGAAFESTIEGQSFVKEAMDSYISEYTANNNRAPSAEEVNQYRQSIVGPANAVFATNMAIVGLSNAVVLGRVFNYGLNRSKNLIEEGAQGLRRTGVNQYKKALQNLSERQMKAMDIAKITGKVLTEGFWEEGGQGITSNTALNYLAAGRDIEGNLENASLASSFTEALKHQFTSNEGWREMLAGMFVGGLGAPGVSVNRDGKKKYWAGGFWEELGATKANIEKTKELLDKHDRIRTKWEAAARDYVLTQEMDADLKSGDFFEAKNKEFMLFFNAVESKVRLGMQEDINFMIDEVVNKFTNEEFSAAFGMGANVSTEEIEKRKQDVASKYKARAKDIKESIENSQISDNLDYNRGVALMTSMARHLDERFAEAYTRLTGTDSVLAEAGELLNLQKALADAEAIKDEKIKKKELELTVKLNSLLHGRDTKAFEQATEEVNAINKEIESIQKEIVNIRKQISKKENRKLYVENTSYEEYTKALEKAVLLDRELADKMTSSINDPDFENLRQDLNRIANKRRDLVNQVNRILSKEGKEQFVNKMQELFEYMAYDSESILMNNLAKIRMAGSLQEDITEKRDYQTREFVALGKSLTDAFEEMELDAQGNIESIELGDTLIEKEIQEVINTLKKSIPADLIETSNIAALLDNLKAQRKAFKDIVDKSKEYLNSKNLEESSDEVKNRVTSVLEKEIEYAEAAIEELDASIKELQTIIDSNAETVNSQTEYMFKTANRLFNIFNFKNKGVSYNIIRGLYERGFTDEQVREYINQNTYIRIDPYPAELDSSVSKLKGSISYNRGIPSSKGLLTASVIFADPDTGQISELGFIMNPKQLMQNGKDINYQELSENSAASINFIKELVEEEIADNKAIEYVGHMNNMSKAFDIMITEFEQNNTNSFSLFDLGLEAPYSSTVNLFEKVESPLSVLQEVMTPNSPYVFSVNGNRYIFAISLDPNDNAFYRDFKVGTVTEEGIDWNTPLEGVELLDLEREIKTKLHKPEKTNLGPNYLLISKSDTSDVYYGNIMQDPSTKNMEDAVTEDILQTFLAAISEDLNTPLEEVKGKALFKKGEKTYHLRLSGTENEKIELSLTITRQNGHYRLGFSGYNSKGSIFLPNSYFLTMKDGKMYLHSPSQAKPDKDGKENLRLYFPRGILFGKTSGPKYVEEVLMKNKSTLQEYLEEMHKAIVASKNGNLIPIDAAFFSNGGPLLEIINREIRTEKSEKDKSKLVDSNIKATGFAVNVKTTLEDSLLGFTRTRSMQVLPAGVSHISPSKATEFKMPATYEEVTQAQKDYIFRFLDVNGNLTTPFTNSNYRQIYQQYRDQLVAEYLSSFEVVDVIGEELTFSEPLEEGTLLETSEEETAAASETEEKTSPTDIDTIDISDVFFKLNALPAEVRLNAEKAVENLKRMFGDNVLVEDISNLVYNLAIKGEVWGSFKNGVIGLNYALAGKGTEYHEAFHKVFRTLLTDKEISFYLNKASKVYGKPKEEDLKDLALLHPNLSKTELTNLWYEEKMSDNFMNKADNLKEGFWKKLWRKIKQFLNIGSDTEQLDYLFAKIYNGGFKKASIKYNVYSNSNTEVYSLVKKRVRLQNKVELKQNFNSSVEKMILNTIYSRSTLEMDQADKDVSKSDIIKGHISILAGAFEKYADYLLKIDPQNIDGFTAQDIAKALVFPDNVNTILKYVFNQIKHEREIFNEDNLSASQDEGNTESKEVFKKEISIGGYKTSSKALKHYLAKISSSYTTLFKNPDAIRVFSEQNPNITLSVNISNLYSQLLKIGTDTPKSKILEKLLLIQDIDPNITSFTQTFFNDIKAELVSRGVISSNLEESISKLPIEKLENSPTYNLIISEIYRSKTDSYDLLFDRLGQGRIVLSNNRNLASFVLKKWALNFDRLNKPHTTAVKEFKSKYDTEDIYKEVRRQYLKATNPEERKIVLSKFVNNIQVDLRDSFGMDISNKLLEYSVLKYLNSKAELVDEESYNILDVMSETALTALPFDFIIRAQAVQNSMYRDKDQNAILNVDVSILKGLAESSALFDPSVTPLVHTTIEGKTVYDIIYNNYNVSRTLEHQKREALLFYEELINSNVDTDIDYLSELLLNAFPDRFTNNPKEYILAIKDNLLFQLGGVTKEDQINALKDIFNEDFKLFFIGGLREREFEENEESEDGEAKELLEKNTSKIARKAGKSYADADPKSKVFYLMSLFSDSIEGAVKEKRVGKKVIKTYLHKPHTPGDGSVVPLIRMPKYSYEKDLRLLSNIYKSEQRRIQNVNREIQNAYNELKKETPNPKPWLDLRADAHFFENGTIWTSYFYNEEGQKVVFSVDKTNITNSLNENVQDPGKSLQGFKLFDMQLLGDSFTESSIIMGQQLTNSQIEDLFEEKYQEFLNDILLPLGLLNEKDGKLVSANLPVGYQKAGQSTLEGASFNTESEVLEKSIKDFFLSSWLNSFSYNTLLYGDPSRTAKDPVDFFKRIKKGAGAGIQGGTGMANIMIVKDIPINFLNHKGEAMGGPGTARADAQTHSHILYRYNLHVKTIKGADTDKARAIYSKLHRGMFLNDQDLEYLDNNYIKHQPGKFLGVSQDLYHKTSDSPIIRNDVSRLKEGADLQLVSSYFDAIESVLFNDPNWWQNPSIYAQITYMYNEIYNNYEAIPGREEGFNTLKFMETNAVQMLVFESAMKGSKYRINERDSEGNYYYYKHGEDLTPEVAFVQMYNRDIMEILNTSGFKKTTTDGTQKMQIIHSEQKDVEVSVNGIKMSAAKAVEIYREYLAKRVIVGHEEKLREFMSLDKNGNLTENINYKLILDRIINSLEQANTDEHTLAFFQLTASENPELKHSMSFPGIMPKAEAIISSMMSSNTLKQKVTGNKFSLASDWWLKVIRDKDNNVIPSGKLVKGVSGKKTDLEYGVYNAEEGIYYSEIILSEDYLKQYGYTYQDFLDNKVPSKLLTFHGVRIPTQDKHSMANFKVVDFVSGSHGNVAIVPQQITLLAGSDFDIDALYTHNYAFFKDLDTGRRVFYGDYLKANSEASAIQAAKEEYFMANRSTINQLYEDKADLILPAGFVDRVSKNYKAFNNKDFSAIQPITRLEANNYLLDLSKALSFNNGNSDINYTPAETETFKQLEKDYIGKELLENKRKFNGVHSPVDNIRAEMSIAHGQKNIGVIALTNTIAQLATLRNSIVTNDKNILFGKGLTLTDSLNKRVNELIDELTTVSTDDLKLQYSVQFNLNTVSMAVTATLGLFGMPKKLAIILNRNPLIHEAIINSKEYGSEIVKDKNGNASLELIASLDNLIESLSAEKLENSSIGIDYFLNITSEDQLNNVLDEVTSIFSKLEKGESIDSLSSYEKSILYTHALLARDSYAISTRLSNVSKIMQLIKGTDSSLDDAMDIYSTIDELGYKLDRSRGKLNIVSKDPKAKENISVKEILNDPFVKAEIDIFDDLMTNQAGKFIISRTKLFSNIVEEMLKIYSSDSKKYNNLRKLISNRLISFLVVRASKNNIEGLKDANLSLILQRGDLEGRERLNEMQKLLKEVGSYPEMRDNFLLKSILGSRVQEYTDPNKYLTHSIYGYTAHFIDGDTRSIKDPIYLDQLQNDFLNLIIADNLSPEKANKSRLLAKSLINYHFVKDGLLFNNNSIAKQIHPDILSSTISQLKKLELYFKNNDLDSIKTLLGADLDSVVEDFVDSVLRQTDKMHMVKGTSYNNLRNPKDRASYIPGVTVSEGKYTFKINQEGVDLGKIASILHAEIEFEKNNDNSYNFLAVPRYFRLTAKGNRFYEVESYETLIQRTFNKNTYYYKVRLDANGYILPDQDTTSGYMQDLLEIYKGRNIKDLIESENKKSDSSNISFINNKVSNSSIKYATEVTYRQTEVINWNEVNLAAATKEEVAMLKNKANTPRPRINTTPYMGEEKAVEKAEVVEENIVTREEIMPSTVNQITEDLQKESFFKSYTDKREELWKVLSNSNNFALVYTAYDGTTVLYQKNSQGQVQHAIIKNNQLDKTNESAKKYISPLLNKNTFTSTKGEFKLMEGYSFEGSNAFVEFVKKYCR